MVSGVGPGSNGSAVAAAAAVDIQAWAFPDVEAVPECYHMVYKHNTHLWSAMEIAMHNWKLCRPSRTRPIGWKLGEALIGPVMSC